MRDGRKTKVPYNPQTIERAKSNEPESFRPFEYVEDAVLGGYVDGMGIRVSNGFSAIDIDHCVTDGILSDAATDICTTMKSYAEKSPSGSGIRVIFKSSDFDFDKEKYYIKNPNNGIEIYVEGVTNRFVTITGNTVYGYPICENPEALQSILDKYMLRPPKKSQQKNFDTETHNVFLDETQVLNKAMQNYNFSSLFNGNMTAYNNDHSSADLALCNMLAFWTGKDPVKIDNLFRKSALMRDKWLRDDYRKNTIDRAVDGCKETYSPYKARTIWDKLDVPFLQTDTWTVDAMGISRTYVKNKKTGETETYVVTSTPIAPAAYLENAETGECKIEIHYMYNGQQRSYVCDKETVLNKTKIIKLANKGINVTSATANDLTKYFSDMERLNTNILPHYTSTSHLGWNGNNFVPYTGDMKFDGEDENATLYQALTQSGELSDWINFMKPLRQNLYFRLIMAASFSSPLIQQCGCLPYWFHLWGTSGTGKTVALMASMSVWGNPQMGKLTRTLNATKNALMSTVAFLHSLPFAGDELQTIKNNYGTYDELIMQLTEGVERNRMKYDKNLPNRYWHCAFISTGEEPITADNSGGGTKNRVIEVEINNKFFGRQGNAIVGFVSNNYGTAGAKFIEHIQNDNVDLKSMYQTINGEILNSVDTTDKQALAASLILLADKLACECLFKDDAPLSVSDIAPFIKSSEETDIAVRSYRWLVDWVAKNENRFYTSQYGEVWGIYENDKVFINSSVLKKEMAKEGFSFDAVKKKWADNGCLIMYGNKYIKRKTIGDNTPYCVEIYLKVEM
jgi:primase-polymerase (primpol)-like protein